MTFVRGNGDFVIEDKTISFIEAECAEEMRLLGYK
jgi:hypothetical protein